MGLICNLITVVRVLILTRAMCGVTDEAIMEAGRGPALQEGDPGGGPCCWAQPAARAGRVFHALQSTDLSPSAKVPGRRRAGSGEGPSTGILIWGQRLSSLEILR